MPTVEMPNSPKSHPPSTPPMMPTMRLTITPKHQFSGHEARQYPDQYIPQEVHIQKIFNVLTTLFATSETICNGFQMLFYVYHIFVKRCGAFFVQSRFADCCYRNYLLKLAIKGRVCLFLCMDLK